MATLHGLARARVTSPEPDWPLAGRAAVTSAKKDGGDRERFFRAVQKIGENNNDDDGNGFKYPNGVPDERAKLWRRSIDADACRLVRSKQTAASLA